MKIKKFLLQLFAIHAVLLSWSCSEVECPLDSVVVMTCDLKNMTTGEKHTLTTPLTITPMNRDTILLNQAQGISNFCLPLKIAAEVDTFLFKFSDAWENKVIDTLIVTHINHPHFQSIDCPASFFHTITSVTWRNQKNSSFPSSIDSVTIKRALVDYENKTNLQIYLRTDF
jgi:hypothetical protein